MNEKEQETKQAEFIEVKLDEWEAMIGKEALYNLMVAKAGKLMSELRPRVYCNVRTINEANQTATQL